MTERSGVRRWFVPILTTSLLAGILPGISQAKKQKVNEEALQVLEKARSLADIRAPGSPPFRAHGRIEAASLAPEKPPFVGQWTLTWQSPSQWREEVSFPGFSQIRVASEGKLWTYRNMAYEPVRVYQVSQLLDFRSQWLVRSGQTITGLKQKNRNGVALQCVEVKDEPFPWRDLCSDPATLLPAWIAPLGNSVASIPSEEYGDYMPWGDRQFPRFMRAYEGDRLILSVQAEIEPAPATDPSQFTPPSSAVEWDWCDNAEPPRKLTTVPPQYPGAEREANREGFVSVYAVVQTDGTLANLAVARSAGRDFDLATLNSVRQWRYRPAMCGDNPIVTETIIDVNYRLRE